MFSIIEVRSPLKNTLNLKFRKRQFKEATIYDRNLYNFNYKYNNCYNFHAISL